MHWSGYASAYCHVSRITDKHCVRFFQDHLRNLPWNLRSCPYVCVCSCRMHFIIVMVPSPKTHTDYIFIHTYIRASICTFKKIPTIKPSVDLSICMYVWWYAVCMYGWILYVSMVIRCMYIWSNAVRMYGYMLYAHTLAQ